LKPQLVSLSEEIVRWGFEVALQSTNSWKIAFTNPTAGPWKKITATDSYGRVGEVHRFEIDETRPDLVIYSDLEKAVIIIEAKTELAGLLDSSQTAKTSEMYDRLAAKLMSCDDNPYWHKRTSYSYNLGLLWGTDEFDKTSKIADLVRKYREASHRKNSDILCIEGAFLDKNLHHKLTWGVDGSIVTIDRILP
jgi:hypothetical protein